MSAVTADTDIWTIGRILQWTAGHFEQKKIASARLDAELLLAAVLKKNRVYLYTNYEQPLSGEERKQYRELVQRRSKFEPVAYILGEREFYGRSFKVNPAVLIPRPETEHLIDSAVAWCKKNQLTAPRILDLGTGSGAIAVTLAEELPEAQIYATDISAEALAVARLNAQNLSTLSRFTFLNGDLFSPLAPQKADLGFDLIVCNPPYIGEPEAPLLMPDVRDHEPALALFAGHDGLSVIRRLCAQAPDFLKKPGLLAFEIGAGQWQDVQSLLRDYTSRNMGRDLQGHSRVALAELC